MDRLIFAELYRLAPTVLNALAVLKPDTVARRQTRPGPFFAARSWAGCTTNMFGFDLRQAQAKKAGPVPTHERLGPDDCENLQV